MGNTIRYTVAIPILLIGVGRAKEPEWTGERGTNDTHRVYGGNR